MLAIKEGMIVLAYDLSDKLVVAIASSALFDLTDSDEVFQSKGEAVYRDYQRENEMKIFRTWRCFSAR